MAFRNDFVGGSDRQGGMGLIGGQAEAGIEKTMTIKLAFFTGAVVVVATALYSIVHYTTSVEWAPATFFENLFVLSFGLILVVLDFPIPHPHQSLVTVRNNIYKFFLFLTRFVGRGIWYLFMASVIFSMFWDAGTSWVLGALFSLYLMGLGGMALYKGGSMSLRLNQVREEILKQNRSAEHYMAPGHTRLSKKQFETMINSVMTDHQTGEPFFTYDELDYVINALSFKPENDGQVTMEEVEYWLSEGHMMSMLMV